MLLIVIWRPSLQIVPAFTFKRRVIQGFAPPVEKLHWLRLPCTLYNGRPGHVVMLQVEKSEQVHSVVGNGTWTRMDASNRELAATEGFQNVGGMA